MVNVLFSCINRKEVFEHNACAMLSAPAHPIWLSFKVKISYYNIIQLNPNTCREVFLAIARAMLEAPVSPILLPTIVS